MTDLLPGVLIVVTIGGRFLTTRLGIYLTIAIASGMIGPIAWPR